MFFGSIWPIREHQNISKSIREDLEHTFLESAADCVSRALQVVDGAMAQGAPREPREAL
jgi:hypothetical protein